MCRQPFDRSEFRRDVVLSAIAIHGNEQRLEPHSAGIDILRRLLRYASRRIRNIEHVVDVRMLDKLVEGFIRSVIGNRQTRSVLQDHVVVVGAGNPVGIRTHQPVEMEPEIGRRCAISVVGRGRPDNHP
jgi:hypothetical protein